MKKGIIVLDMPEQCSSCRFSCNTNSIDFCFVVIKEPELKKHTKIPDWCPIKPLPKKDNNSYFPDEYQDGYSEGWNACIDALGGQ